MKRILAFLILAGLTTLTGHSQQTAPYPTFVQQIVDSCQAAGWPTDNAQCLPIIIAVGKIVLAQTGTLTQPPTVAPTPVPVVTLPVAPVVTPPSSSSGGSAVVTPNVSTVPSFGDMYYKGVYLKKYAPLAFNSIPGDTFAMYPAHIVAP